MLDLVIRGNRVVTPHGVGACDVAVASGKIAAVAAAGTFESETTRRLVDAGDMLVIPGGIDPHVHCSWPVPAGPEGTPALSEPPLVVSRAALYGGTTTLIDFAQAKQGNSIADAVSRRDKEWSGQCYCDYSYHIMVEGSLAPELFGQLDEAIRSGYPTVKMFTTDVRPLRSGRMVNFGDIWEVLKVTARAGGLCVIHGEDNDIVMHMYDRLFREGRVGFENMSEVHNTLSEDLSFRRVIRLAESVPGAALYFMHVSAATGVDAIRDARVRGIPVYGETLHQYLVYTEDDYKRPNGQIYHTYPSLKSKTDQDALWSGTEVGVIHTVATDEVCCKLAVKLQGRRIDDTTGGNSAVEPRLGVMYTEMVGLRSYSVEKFVDLTSTNAAKIMGLYPRKGAIAAGSDADIAILDTSRRMKLTKELLHETDYTPWEGYEVYGWPAMTILRGKVVVAAGRFLGDPKDGQYLYRHIPEEIRSRPQL
jgi:dihydropyrimidinase